SRLGRSRARYRESHACVDLGHRACHRSRSQPARGDRSSAFARPSNRSRREPRIRNQPARTGQASPGLCQNFGSSPPRQRPGPGRFKFLPSPNRPTLEHLRPGPSALWKRLAKQRHGRHLPARAEYRPRVLHSQGTGRLRKILLEKFNRGVPLDKTRRKPTKPVLNLRLLRLGSSTAITESGAGKERSSTTCAKCITGPRFLNGFLVSHDLLADRIFQVFSFLDKRLGEWFAALGTMKCGISGIVHHRYFARDGDKPGQPRYQSRHLARNARLAYVSTLWAC